MDFAVIGRIKVFGVKFADDVVAQTVDTEEGLKNMINDLEKYCGDWTNNM